MGMGDKLKTGTDGHDKFSALRLPGLAGALAFLNVPVGGAQLGQSDVHTCTSEGSNGNGKHGTSDGHGSFIGRTAPSASAFPSPWLSPSICFLSSTPSLSSAIVSI